MCKRVISVEWGESWHPTSFWGSVTAPGAQQPIFLCSHQFDPQDRGSKWNIVRKWNSVVWAAWEWVDFALGHWLFMFLFASVILSRTLSLRLCCKNMYGLLWSHQSIKNALNTQCSAMFCTLDWICMKLHMDEGDDVGWDQNDCDLNVERSCWYFSLVLTYKDLPENDRGCPTNRYPAHLTRISVGGSSGQTATIPQNSLWLFVRTPTDPHG